MTYTLIPKWVTITTTIFITMNLSRNPFHETLWVSLKTKYSHRSTTENEDRKTYNTLVFADKICLFLIEVFDALTPSNDNTTTEGLCPNRNLCPTTTQGQKGRSTMKRILDPYLPSATSLRDIRTIHTQRTTSSGANSTHQLSRLGSVAGHQLRRVVATTVLTLVHLYYILCIKRNTQPPGEGLGTTAFGRST